MICLLAPSAEHIVVVLKLPCIVLAHLGAVAPVMIEMMTDAALGSTTGA